MLGSLQAFHDGALGLGDTFEGVTMDSDLSRCEWRSMHGPITLPSSMFGPANRLVVPLLL